MDEKPIRFDEHGKLSPEDWDRLLSRLDEEIRQVEEAAARKAGWTEECDELFFLDEDALFDEECEEEGEEEPEEEQEDGDEEPAEYFDPDDF